MTLTVTHKGKQMHPVAYYVTIALNLVIIAILLRNIIISRKA